MRKWTVRLIRIIGMILLCLGFFGVYWGLQNNTFNGIDLIPIFTFPVSIFFICASEERLNNVFGRKK